MSQEKRTKRVEIRLTDDEYRQLLERKTKPRLAEWLRDVALNAQPRKQARPVDPRLLYELNRIGVNLNQIARYCNQHQGDIKLVDISLTLQDIEQQLREVREDAK